MPLLSTSFPPPPPRRRFTSLSFHYYCIPKQYLPTKKICHQYFQASPTSVAKGLVHLLLVLVLDHSSVDLLCRSDETLRNQLVKC